MANANNTNNVTVDAHKLHDKANNNVNDASWNAGSDDENDAIRKGRRGSDDADPNGEVWYREDGYISKEKAMAKEVKNRVS